MDKRIIIVICCIVTISKLTVLSHMSLPYDYISNMIATKENLTYTSTVQPSSVTCKRKCCVWPNDLDRSCMYRNLYFVDKKFYFASTKPCPNEDVWKQEHDTFLVDRILWGINNTLKTPQSPTCIGIKDLEKLIFESNVTIRDEHFVLYSPFYPLQIGHDTFNNQCSSFSLLLEFLDPISAIHTKYVPLVWSTRSLNMGSRNVRKARESFSGFPVEFVSDWEKDDTFARRLNWVAMGNNGMGCDDVSMYYRYKRYKESEAKKIVDILYQFQLRYLETYSIKPRQEKHAEHVHVAVIENKRKNLQTAKLAKHLQRTLESKKFKVTYVKFKGPERYNEIPNLLKLLQTVDIFVSGIGTAMMWAAFLPPGSVVVNIVQAWEGRHQPLTTQHDFSQMFMPYLRTVYYPVNGGREPLNFSMVTSLVLEAKLLYDDGFQTNASSPVLENLSPIGQAFYEILGDPMSIGNPMELLSIMSGNNKKEEVFPKRCRGGEWKEHFTETGIRYPGMVMAEMFDDKIDTKICYVWRAHANFTRISEIAQKYYKLYP